MNAMETKAKNPWVAGILSGVLPGLGQFYNRQVAKGVAFLIGFLVLAGILVFGVDLQAVDKAIASGARPESLWMILAVEVLMLILAIWSITDAARTAKRTPK
jgi:uncharacterized membrane protein YjgN (DUF898 family)